MGATIAMAGCILFSVGVVEQAIGGISLEDTRPVFLIPAWLLYMLLATGIGYVAVHFLSELQDRDRPHVSAPHYRRMVVFKSTVAFKLALLILWVGMSLLVTEPPIQPAEMLLLSFSSLLLADGLGFVGVIIVG